MILLTETKCKIGFIYVGKKKSEVKKCLEIMTIRGGGGARRLMEKTILNFHFDYLTTSLKLSNIFYSTNGAESMTIGIFWNC